jgi:hypothetical protein
MEARVRHYEVCLETLSDSITRRAVLYEGMLKPSPELKTRVAFSSRFSGMLNEGRLHSEIARVTCMGPPLDR